MRPSCLPHTAACWRYLDFDQGKSGIEYAKIAAVRGDDPLTASTPADHYVGIDDVGGSAGRKEPPHVGGIDPVEGDDRCRGLAYQTSKPYLAFGSAYRLSQGRCRHGDRRARLSSSRQEHDDLPIISVEGDQSASIEGQTWHQATERVRRFWLPSISSAQSFSSCERGPPVSRSACASVAPHPAMSSSDTLTACCTNPETLDAFPDSTSPRTRSSCSASRVIVIFLVAIPATILSPWRARHQKSV